MNARIRDEGFKHSRVLETALALSDDNGPRLAGSPGYLKAARWAATQLKNWGLEGAHLEAWGVHGRSWVLEDYSAEMTAPYYLRLNAFPRAWAGDHLAVSGTPIVAPITEPKDFARSKGKLRGRIVLADLSRPVPRRADPLFHRFTEAELDAMAKAPVEPGPFDFWAEYEDWAVTLRERDKVMAFLRDEGATALLVPSPNDEFLKADGWWSYAGAVPGALPTFVVAREQYNRLIRLANKGGPFKLTLSFNAHFETGDSTGYNVVAELPGTDPTLAPQLVMMGGHLDSWIGGTGATDNAAGCAVVMEAMRILKTVGARPRRTIRMALWDGEENSADDYGGSMGYVRRHFAAPETMKTLPEHARLSTYLNLDNGTGKIRGIYLQGDTAALPVFRALLEPLRDLGAAHVIPGSTGETDHISFQSVGLPGFEMVQDPVDYDRRTHHTTMDVGDYLLEDDLKQASVVMASLVYHLANRDGMVPRPVLPGAKRK
ncbi:MAG: M20/M25/M40 family metallo-hydrolase [Gemmatimonadota bacterium]